MDSGTSQSSNLVLKKNVRDNEEKKEIESNGDQGVASGPAEANETTGREVPNISAELIGDSEDLVNTMNYNTITSLAALKDILQGDGNNTPEADTFFQHYFMNHCNSLSSHNSTLPFPFTERRRLSQCREEDEDDEKTVPGVSGTGKGSHYSPDTPDDLLFDSDDAGKQNLSRKTDLSTQITDSQSNQSPQKRTVMGVRHKFLVSPATPPVSLSVERAVLTQTHNAHTVHDIESAKSLRPNVNSIFPGQNLHRDKKYFDSNLIEIRSTVDGVTAKSEDIWVKRTDSKQVRKIIRYFYKILKVLS